MRLVRGHRVVKPHPHSIEKQDPWRELKEVRTIFTVQVAVRFTAQAVHILQAAWRPAIGAINACTTEFTSHLP